MGDSLQLSTYVLIGYTALRKKSQLAFILQHGRVVPELEGFKIKLMETGPVTLK